MVLGMGSDRAGDGDAALATGFPTLRQNEKRRGRETWVNAPMLTALALRNMLTEIAVE
jgi:hypothetical protein